MNTYPEKYQISYFGSWDDVVPSSETISLLLEAFQGENLLPTTIQQIALAANGPKQIQRLRLASTEEEWVLDIEPNRINLSQTSSSPFVDLLGDVGEFASIGRGHILRVLNQFPKLGSRLALVSRYFLDKIDTADTAQVLSLFVNPIRYYNENPPVNWEVRSNARVPMDLGAKQELLNVITKISRVQCTSSDESGFETESDRLKMEIDINTFQGNKETRFSEDHLGEFLSRAMTLESEIKHAIEEKIDA